MSMFDYDVKYCPFCGRIPRIIDMQPDAFSIKCDKCGIEMKRKTGEVDIKTVRRWNDRAAPEPVLCVEDGTIDTEAAEALGYRVLVYRQEIERCLERFAMGKATDVMNFDYAGTLAYIQQLKAENAALRERLEKAIKVPCEYGDIFYRFFDCPIEMVADMVCGFRKDKDGEIYVSSAYSESWYNIKECEFSREAADARIAAGICDVSNIILSADNALLDIVIHKAEVRSMKKRVKDAERRAEVAQLIAERACELVFSEEINDEDWVNVIFNYKKEKGIREIGITTNILYDYLKDQAEKELAEEGKE